MAQQSVLESFIEDDGWHLRLKHAVKGVESVEESFEMSDGRSSQASWSTSESESGSLSRTSTGSSFGSSLSSSTGRSMNGIEEHGNESLIRTASEMRRVFDTYDVNGDGQICKSELGSFMKKLDVDVSEEEVASMIKSADKNGDGFVDFEEFLELHTSLVEGEFSPESGDKVDEETELREAFQMFDKNEDGFISVIELQSILRNLGINSGVNLQDCQIMISVVDRNNDGQVDFAEFKQLMAGFPCAV